MTFTWAPYMAILLGVTCHKGHGALWSTSGGQIVVVDHDRWF
jgi:hypothetical protein